MLHAPLYSADRPVVVIGGGPAGLTAAYELTQRDEPVLLFEQDAELGGLARTVVYKGFRFDIGGHRFFTKVRLVHGLWRSILGPDFLKRPRLSRIYYRRRFFDYPLKPSNALRNLGIMTSLQVLLSYLWVKVRPVRPEVSFADWVSNRFGRRLYRIFFETYTEKVWGIAPSKIGAQWAAQRIKGLSLRTAVLHMLFPGRSRSGGQTVKTLIDEFEYPRLGPGMMWERLAGVVVDAGGHVETETRVVAVHHAHGAIRSIDVQKGDERRAVPLGHLISSMPVRELVKAMSPPAPEDVRSAADRLKYRDFLTVALIVDEPELFPDNWIYVHDDAVRVGRIQNFKNWSPEMVPDARQTCLGLEYFCFEGDGLWSMSDDELVRLGTREVAALGLIDPARVSDGAVVRMRKAYPVYDDGYADALETIRGYLDRFSNLQLVGRNGMHKYNNQDHSMLTAMLAVRNLYGEQHDLWSINAEEDYHEEVVEDSGVPAEFEDEIRQLGRTQPRVPRQLPTSGR